MRTSCFFILNEMCLWKKKTFLSFLLCARLFAFDYFSFGIAFCRQYLFRHVLILKKKFSFGVMIVTRIYYFIYLFIHSFNSQLSQAMLYLHSICRTPPVSLYVLRLKMFRKVSFILLFKMWQPYKS